MVQEREPELDVGVLAGAIGRKLWLLVLLAILAAVATYFALSFVDPLYTADARVLIEQRESPLTRPRDQAGEAVVQYDESAIQSQVEVFRSRGIADAVIDELDLLRRPDFDPAMHPSPLTRLLVLLGIRDNPVEETIRQRIMDAYFDRLSVYPVGKSRVIGVEFEASDPQLAAEVTNAVVGAFVEQQEQAKRETALAATDWLEGEIARLRDQVAAAEQKIADYQRSEGLYSVPGDGSTSGNLSTQQLSDLNAELARARAARSEAEARASLIRSLLDSNGALEASPDVLQSPLIQRLQERQVALRSQIADLSTTLLPAHPRIRALQRQIGDLNGQIATEANKVLRSLETAARVAAAREQSLEESLDLAKDVASVSNDQEIELRALEREAASQRDLLETLLARYREASARTDAGYMPADARIISRAVPPADPSFPRKGMMSLAAAFGTLLIVGAIVILREFTTGRVFRAVDSGTVATTAAIAPAAATAGVAPQPAQPDAPLIPSDPVSPAPAATAQAAGPAAAAAMPASLAAAAVAAPPAAAAAEPEDGDLDEPVVVPASGPVSGTDAAPAVAGEGAAAEESVALVHGPQADTDTDTEADGAAAPVSADLAPATGEAAGAQPGDAAFAAGLVAAAGAAAVAAEEEPAPGTGEKTGTGEAAEADVVVASEDAAATEPADPADEITALPAFAEGERPGTAALAEVLANPALRTMLFAGATGGEHAGDVALAASRAASRRNLRIAMVDVGVTPSRALGGFEAPGLSDLLGGEVSFGEVIRRDERSGVHVIPYGQPEGPLPYERLSLVIGALTHTYDKVVVVADALADWPHESFAPDCAAIVCNADAPASVAEQAYEQATANGAQSALIVRFGGDDTIDDPQFATA